MTIDLYTLPHKALRHAVATAGTALAAAEPRAAAPAAAAAREAVEALHAHGSHEDEFVRPLLDRFLPDVGGEVAAQHCRLDTALGALARHIDELGAGEASPDALLTLYRAFQRLAARNLVHLDHEETVVMPALALAVPPGALEDLTARFQAAHPEAADLYRRWPEALNLGERRLLGLA